MNDKGLLSAYKEANQHTWTQEELDAYDYADMRKEDGKAQSDAAVKKALAKAKKETEKETEKREVETILGFYELGVTTEKIAKALKITEEKVSKIIETSQNKNKH